MHAPIECKIKGQFERLSAVSLDLIGFYGQLERAKWLPKNHEPCYP